MGRLAHGRVGELHRRVGIRLLAAALAVVQLRLRVVRVCGGQVPQRDVRRERLERDEPGVLERGGGRHTYGGRVR